MDAALIHSTIDTIPSPNSLLGRMGGARGVVRENGGLVVVVSAYEWNEEVTPVGAWLGGYLDDAGNKVGWVATSSALSVNPTPSTARWTFSQAAGLKALSEKDLGSLNDGCIG